MWKHAIQMMNNDISSSYGPKSFLKYCNENDFQNSGTANNISIDYYEKLHKQLRDECIMVLRMGSFEKIAGTNFLLVRYEQKEDFFFFDDKIFTCQETMYETNPNVKNAISIMNIFNNYSEMMLVSYLLSCGVMSEVLGLDKSQIYYTPLTGRNNYTFEFYPNKNCDAILHINGQVEIDAVFTGYRNGVPIVVVVEAKVENGRYGSLAKHKLFYAYKSIQSILKDEYEIIPIYIKLSVNESILTAKIAICKDIGNCLVNFEVVDSRVIIIEI